GTLTLTAGNSANSITTNTSGTINVLNFDLAQGEWTQTSASNPAFNVSNNFIIGSGTAFNGYYNAEFIRNMGTTVISSNTFNLIADVFGLQGIATQTFSNNYALSGNVDASVTKN